MVSIDGFLTAETVQMVKEVMESPERREEMVNNNYEIAKQHFSYAALKKQLNSLSLGLFDSSCSTVIPLKTVRRRHVADVSEGPKLARVSV